MFRCPFDFNSVFLVCFFFLSSFSCHFHLSNWVKKNAPKWNFDCECYLKETRGFFIVIFFSSLHLFFFFFFCVTRVLLIDFKMIADGMKTTHSQIFNEETNVTANNGTDIENKNEEEEREKKLKQEKHLRTNLRVVNSFWMPTMSSNSLFA